VSGEFMECDLFMPASHSDTFLIVVTSLVDSHHIL